MLTIIPTALIGPSSNSASLPEPQPGVQTDDFVLIQILSRSRGESAPLLGRFGDGTKGCVGNINRMMTKKGCS